MFQFLLTKLDLLEARGQKQAYSSGRLVAMTKDGGGYIDPWYVLLYAAFLLHAATRSRAVGRSGNPDGQVAKRCDVKECVSHCVLLSKPKL